MQFTAYSKKEMVRDFSFFGFSLFLLFLWMEEIQKCERRAEGKARGLGGDPGCAVSFYALV